MRLFYIEKEINFYGNQINPYSFMKAADLLLFPSIHEAAGLVVENKINIYLIWRYKIGRNFRDIGEEF